MNSTASLTSENTSKPQALYRFYGADGELLYIGITSNPGARWKDHASDKAWWTEVDTVTIEHYEDRDAVEAAEVAAIRAESPRYNRIRYTEKPADKAPPTPGEIATLLAIENDKKLLADMSSRAAELLAERDYLCENRAKPLIVELLRAGEPPTEVADLSPFSAAWVRNLARASGIPPASRGRRRRDE